MKITQNKFIFIIIGILLLIFFIFHSIIVSRGYTSFIYERLRDFIIIMITLWFCIYNTKLFLKNKKNEIIFLILANLFAVILIIHILRLILKGLLC